MEAIMKTKHLVLAGMLASLPLSAGLQANCKGLNAQEADLKALYMKHKTGQVERKLIAVDKPKYAKAMWFMGYELPIVQYALQKGDDAVCSTIQMDFKEAVEDLEQSSYFLP